MEKVYNNRIGLYNLLFPESGYRGLDYLHNGHRALLIHSSILSNVRQWITKSLEDECFADMGPYELKVGENFYDMRLVFVTKKFPQKYSFIERAQFSCVWQNEVTLFRDVERFSELEEFIKTHQLEEFIIATEIREPGINSHNKSIKIVTFSEQVNYERLINNFERFLTSKYHDYYSQIHHFYITEAFPWLQPSRLRPFDKSSVDDCVYINLITYLTCQRELSHKKEFALSIIELCAIRLAFCSEVCNESHASIYLAQEIDSAVIHSLNRMAESKSDDYFRNGHFNLYRYARDRKCDLFVDDLACCYFIYCYQDWYRSITIPTGILSIEYISRFTARKVDLCEEHEFVARRLGSMSNVSFQIDGTNFAGMNFKLLANILGMGNVHEITLDSNYRWINSPDESNFLCDNRPCQIRIVFIGNNQFEFIEDCIKFLALIKTIDQVSLILSNQTLKNFVVLKNVRNVERIYFSDIKLTSSILREFMECEFSSKTEIHFTECKIDDDVSTWMLLNEFNYNKAEFVEEENTWQYLFESVVHFLQNSETNEFTFDKDLRILTSNGITLEDFTFAIDDQNARLELRDRISMRPVDLYELKMNLLDDQEKKEDDHVSCYEFYQ